MSAVAAMDHNLLVAGDDQRLADAVGPFLAEGVDAGDAVIAVLAEGNREVIGDALGSVADDVTFIPCEQGYARPEAALADYDAAVRRLLAEGAPRVRLCGELPPCATQHEWDGWVAYEALLNPAFGGRPVSLLCVYDERRIPARVIDAVRRAHPHVLGDTRMENPRFEDPAQVVRDVLVPDATPLPALEELPCGARSRELRERLEGAMSAAGVDGARAGAMLTAAGEVLANARRHGGGVRSVRAGGAGEDFVCEIRDHGSGFDDPFAGRLPPAPADSRGAGLWVARQQTRRLDLLPSPDGGVIARIWV